MFTVRPARINALLGSELTAGDMAGLLAPLGIEAVAAGAEDDAPLQVTVPTFRPDIRPAPAGEADIAEEVARTYGYSRIARRTPSWPQPGRLTPFQRDRRLVKDVLCGLGCHEVWTSTFVSESDQRNSGFDPPYVEVTNPLVESERFLRSSMAGGLVQTVVYNTERRQGEVQLFEVGSVFRIADDRSGDRDDGPAADIAERLSAIFARQGDDAWTAMAAWTTVADALRIDDWVLGDPSELGPSARMLHSHRSASLAVVIDRAASGNGRQAPVGAVGELDPHLAAQFGLVNPDGRPRRAGWLDLDIGILLDRERIPRRSEEARPITRFPSSDIDLAFVVEESVAGRFGRADTAPFGWGSARVGRAVRRLPGAVGGGGVAEPRLPAAVQCPGPDAHRRGDGPVPFRLHRRGGDRARGPIALSRAYPGLGRIEGFEGGQGPRPQPGDQVPAVLGRERVEEGQCDQFVGGAGAGWVPRCQVGLDDGEGPLEQVPVGFEDGHPFGHEVGQFGEDHRLTRVVVARLDHGQIDGHEFGEAVDEGSDQEAPVLGSQGLGSQIDDGCGDG